MLDPYFRIQTVAQRRQDRRREGRRDGDRHRRQDDGRRRRADREGGRCAGRRGRSGGRAHGVQPVERRRHRVFREHQGRAPATACTRCICPMVKKQWLQKGDKVSNPYYGKSMLTCGRRRRRARRTEVRVRAVRVQVHRADALRASLALRTGSTFALSKLCRTLAVRDAGDFDTIPGITWNCDASDECSTTAFQCSFTRTTRCPLVAVNLWYHVGSKNERPGRTGLAHLFEHLMFEGSAHHDSGYFQPLQAAGALLNGSTNADRTNYWEVVPDRRGRARAVARVRPHGLSAAGAHRGQVRQPARRRPQRAAAELREPPVRPRGDGACWRRSIRPTIRITG